ncbi:MAG: hypothetical protein II393_02845 [Cytophagales bacterium]|nr:hypothetical protein [Cytophagales bacterium]
MIKQTLSLLYKVDIFFAFIFPIHGDCCRDLFHSRPKATKGKTLCNIITVSKNEVTCKSEEDEEIKSHKKQKKENNKEWKTEYNIFLNSNKQQRVIKIQDKKTKINYTFTIEYNAGATGFYTDTIKYFITKTTLIKNDEVIKIDNKKKCLNNDEKPNKIVVNID